MKKEELKDLYNEALKEVSTGVETGDAVMDHEIIVNKMLYTAKLRGEELTKEEADEFVTSVPDTMEETTDEMKEVSKFL
ncbi:MAG: hypothetical protein ACOYJJ_01790 [Anaerovoracaceae bacterium]|jgi:hypothetical protein